MPHTGYMDTNTLVMDPVEVEKIVTSEECSASGVQRRVWFLDGVVVKKDGCGGRINTLEHEQAEAFVPSEFKVEGQSWTVRVPKTAMVGVYLIMERINLPHTKDWGIKEQFECKYCTPQAREAYWTRDETHWVHGRRCFTRVVFNAAINHVNYDRVPALRDMHAGNFILDFDAHVMWVIDLGF